MNYPTASSWVSGVSIQESGGSRNLFMPIPILTTESSQYCALPGHHPCAAGAENLSEVIREAQDGILSRFRTGAATDVTENKWSAVTKTEVMGTVI